MADDTVDIRISRLKTPLPKQCIASGMWSSAHFFSAPHPHCSILCWSLQWPRAFPHVALRPGHDVKQRRLLLQLRIWKPCDSEQCSVVSQGFVGKLGKEKVSLHFWLRRWHCRKWASQISSPQTLIWRIAFLISNTRERVKMANANLHFALSTSGQALKCPSSWNSFLSST